MTKKELEALLKEYPLPDGRIAWVPELQEPTNYWTDWEMGIYEEQLKSCYRLPLHPFALKVFHHYKMAPGQLVPYGWRKLVGLIYLVETSGYKVDPTDFLEVFFELYFVKGVSSTNEMASGSGVLQKAKGKRKEKAPSVVQAPALKKTKVHLLDFHPRVIEGVSTDEDPIFQPKWTIKQDDMGMPNGHISKQHPVHGVLPKDMEILVNQTHESLACTFAQAVYSMYACSAHMLSRFEMARKVAGQEGQEKREAITQAEEAAKHAQELTKREADLLAQVSSLKKRLERGNARDEWLKNRTEDGLEIYELGFRKAKEMFPQQFLDIPLNNFVMPAFGSPSGVTIMPSEVEDVTSQAEKDDQPVAAPSLRMDLDATTSSFRMSRQTEGHVVVTKTGAGQNGDGGDLDRVCVEEAKTLYQRRSWPVRDSKSPICGRHFHEWLCTVEWR
ncbi:LOW QUALITY PROTEIN: hypothetical protein RJ640_005865 [Escallonia rubra]|uniref:Transposase (putative) gypsy type domain-containing protein n=1 Tax=Escallonia rubra TaxID=112253 RepID=A0AA88RQ25_9ASTE|nr:LOW QUALITY PROTEIN: hypothetical protein RJ640_005865 [Escallonia rubra]